MTIRVLVVEDNRVIREVMRKQLNSLGVNCYLVETAEEGVELARFFDLVLMDVELPCMSGIEATRKIRELERVHRLQTVPIVATTCSDTRNRCLAAGMNDFCAKPVRREDLARILDDWLYPPEKIRSFG